ncbi:hypothetical protein [Hoyosella subflava]|uniref:Uncharacterized protein n=1 Tax=Hoyosella subflava (strain DSM 45089 / JCM 17490 / NBRC 109087 / DQS3-9A1) TaxID=443218 RepID=F6EEL0_HOYSD|nr:hypothetical protein [Hoyosella subflava]AEF39707.1 hypothetical protein AS9A_1255 [Hoyosella subflava DQS3-9A1]
MLSLVPLRRPAFVMPAGKPDQADLDSFSLGIRTRPSAQSQYPWGMVIVDVALLPVRVGIIGARVTVMASQWVRPDGPIRRDNGLLDMADVVVGKRGVADQLFALLANPYGPVALLRAITSATAPDRPLGQALERGGMIEHVFDHNGLIDKVFQSGGFVERVLTENGLAERMVHLMENLVAIAPAIDGLQEPLARIESASRYITDAAEPITDMAGRFPRPRFPRVARANASEVVEGEAAPQRSTQKASIPKVTSKKNSR